MEDGESALETARREIVEETGCQADPQDLGVTQSFMIESQYLASKGYVAPIIAHEIAFSAHLDSRLPIRLDPEEHDAYGWFPFDEAYEKIQWTDDREALEIVEKQLSLIAK
jgi:dATP pyrophosphohydrolase